MTNLFDLSLLHIFKTKPAEEQRNLIFSLIQEANKTTRKVKVVYNVDQTYSFRLSELTCRILSKFDSEVISDQELYSYKCRDSKYLISIINKLEQLDYEPGSLFRIVEMNLGIMEIWTIYNNHGYSVETVESCIKDTNQKTTEFKSEYTDTEKQ